MVRLKVLEGTLYGGIQADFNSSMVRLKESDR